MNARFDKYGQYLPGTMAGVMSGKARKVEALAALHPEIRDDLLDICSELDYAARWFEAQEEKECAG